MAQTQGKKITVGSVLGLLVVVAVVIAQQKGWLPADGGPDAGNNNRTSQNDPLPNPPAPPESQATREPAEQSRPTPRDTEGAGTAVLPDDDGGIGEHFRAQRSDVIVTASGIVKKRLPDDNEGSRHQKLIVTLSTGQTVLIAHNIDLAERVPCDEGDVIRFRGEYEWSSQGGVVHWTHHDPAGRHQPGWIEHEGVRYE
ncbi:MAG: DUF3465 domain-containing protein [Planctomycetota bacterium]